MDAWHIVGAVLRFHVYMSHSQTSLGGSALFTPFLHGTAKANGVACSGFVGGGGTEIGTLKSGFSYIPDHLAVSPLWT